MARRAEPVTTPRSAMPQRSVSQRASVRLSIWMRTGDTCPEPAPRRSKRRVPPGPTEAAAAAAAVRPSEPPDGVAGMAVAVAVGEEGILKNAEGEVGVEVEAKTDRRRTLSKPDISLTPMLAL